MGIGCVILLWALVGTALATVGAAVLAFVTRAVTKGATGARKRAILIACIFPFFCLGWTVVVFTFQAVINETLLDRDAGIGDTWHCPLPNGYAITMIDVMDYGWVYNERLQPSRTALTEGEGSISGVRLLQVSGKYIFGGADSNWSSRVDDNKGDSNVSFYFLIDTQAGHRADFSTVEELRAAASQAGTTLTLEPIQSVYAKYRFTWFDMVVGVLELVPIVLFAVLLVRLILKLRTTQNVVQQTA